jgi:hypothetical protein
VCGDGRFAALNIGEQTSENFRKRPKSDKHDEVAIGKI